MTNYKVSVIVPVYGVERYIKRCAESLFEQTYDDIEYIFVDDSSPDKSIEILEHVVEQYPNRHSQVNIKRHTKNRGLSAARNTGIAAATGDFVLQVDSDDWIENTTIEKCVAKQMERDADIVRFDIDVMRPHNRLVYRAPECMTGKELCLAMIRKQCAVSVWGGFYRRELYTANNIQCEEGTNIGEDYHTTTRLAYYAKNVDFIHEQLYHYDNTNATSYTNVFKWSSYRQERRSFDIVGDFVADKQEEYREAFRYADCQWYVTALKICVLAGVDGTREEFERCKAIVRNMPRKYLVSSHWRHRLLIFMPYDVATVYMHFVAWAGNTFRK